ncbi:scarecrow protein [Salix suchowensis]|nr:scarecrow protein [Salix suchowensis]
MFKSPMNKNQTQWTVHGLDPHLLSLITVASATEDVPPMLDLSYEELDSKLVNFARSRNVIMEFRVIPSSYADGFSSFDRANSSATHNCHMMLHYIHEESLSGFPSTKSNPYSYESSCSSMSSLRTAFLKSLRSLGPTIAVLVDEYADLTANNLVCRLRSAFNYLWIPFDTVDTFLPGIMNVISYEGLQRVERLEPKIQWIQRMRNANFRGNPFAEDAVSEVKIMLDEHAAGWGLKKEDDDLVLTWKGNNVVFATAWLPV